MNEISPLQRRRSKVQRIITKQSLVLHLLVTMMLVIVTQAGGRPPSHSARASGLTLTTEQNPVVRADSHGDSLNTKVNPTTTMNSQPGEYMLGEVLVGFEPGVTISVLSRQDGLKIQSNALSVQETLEELGVQETHLLFQSEDRDWSLLPSEMRNVHKLVFSIETDVLQVVRTIEALPQVKFAEPNYIFQPSVIPNDGFYGDQWGLHKINAAQAWDITTGDTSIKIAIIDSGIDSLHPDLSAKITNAYDYVHDDSTPEDDLGHGTHVAGIAAASTNNGGLGTDVAGVSWGSPIVPLKVCYKHWLWGDTCPNDLVTAAILDAADIVNVRVINLSLGGPSYSQAQQNAVTYAYERGVTVVAAPGNENTPNLRYPAAYEHVIAVAATNKSDNKYWRSNYGSYIDLAAPGEGILSTVATGPSGGSYYGYKNGTSMATPFVSGLATLVYSVLPASERTPDRVEHILEATAQDLGSYGWDTIYGWGRIDAYRAVSEASDPPTLDFRALLYCSSRTDHSAPIKVRIREPETQRLLREETVTTNSDGRYYGLALFGIPSGDYDVIVKAPASISKRVSSVHFTAGQSTFVDFAYLRGGDFNNDDKINELDLSRVLSAFDPEGTSEPDPLIDMTGDGLVNALDLGILLSGFNCTGADFANTQEPSSQMAVTGTSAGSGTLQLLPSSGTYNVGQEFDVQVHLDTGGAAIDGVDIIVRYDPCALEVLSISDGTAFSSYPVQSSHPEWGEIHISGNNTVDETFNGSGTLGVVRFRVIRGNTPSGVLVMFKPTGTVDSNMAENDTSNEILGSVGNASFFLNGTPTRPPLSGTFMPPGGSYLTPIEIPVTLDLNDACGGVVAEEVAFGVYYDSVWHALETDRNKYNGWSTSWNTSSVMDQVISLRAIVTDTNGHSTTMTASNLTLDRVAPTSTITAPVFLPVGEVFTVTWGGSDNLSGLASYDVHYKDGQDGLWIEWQSQTTKTSAVFVGEERHNYYFRIRARDVAGNIAAFSAEQAVVGDPFEVYLPLVVRNYVGH